MAHTATNIVAHTFFLDPEITENVASKSRFVDPDGTVSTWNHAYFLSEVRAAQGEATAEIRLREFALRRAEILANKG